MDKITAIIVDDENKSRSALSGLLKKYFSEIDVIAECASGNEAYSVAVELRPALVFLDIEMPSGTGFDFIEKFKILPFEIIFLTAYDQYALKAMKASALDYLLKPLSIEELGLVVEKVKTRLKEKDTVRQYEALLQNFNPEWGLRSLAVPTQYGLEFLEIKRIVMLEADGNYTHIHLLDGKSVTSSKTLGDYEAVLPGSMFFRAHHSHIINLLQIRKYYRGDGGHVVMSNGVTVGIAKRKKREFLEAFGV